MNDELFEAWRSNRANVNPPPGFADRVMESIAVTPIPSPGENPRRSWSWGIRTGLMAAAVAVALFRAAELLSVFSATGLENGELVSMDTSGNTR
jgi:hypothetical protein